MTDYNKPLPDVHAVSKEYWDAAKRHELVLQRCLACSHIQHYPRSLCSNCLSSNLEWIKASGKGKVYTFTVVHQPGHPAFMMDVPYVFAIIELEEGPHFASNIVECEHEDVKIDMPVTAVFEDVTPEVTLTKFKPA